MSKLHLKIVCIVLLYLIYPFLSSAETTIYYGTTAKRDCVFFHSKSTVALTDNGWLQMSIYDFPLFKDGQRTTMIATVSGKMGDVITSGNVDGDDFVAFHFRVYDQTHTDGVMIITLNQNGMIVKFEYCIINQNNELDSILLMMVDRQSE